jgi:predicted N-acetyltransferase YhbS
MVTIRRCRHGDVAEVLTFLNTHWKPGHIFTVHRELFDWQHARTDAHGDYSFAIARSGNGDLVGVLGYILTSHFDPALAQSNTLWLALWSVRPDWKASGVGLQLLKFVAGEEAQSCVVVGVVGFADGVGPLYEAMGFTVGEMRHYVMPNPDMRDFELAVLNPHRKLASGTSRESGLVRAVPLTLSTGEPLAMSRRTQLPAKSTAYFRARYLGHPIYDYRCHVIEREGQTVGLLATRVAEHGNRKALRVVDYSGEDDVVPGLGPLILEQLRRTGAEYADVYNSGIDADLFGRAGFTEVQPEGPDIVPDHFEPFERRNVRIRFAVKAHRPVVLFKGDGDQDRPNRP